MLTIKYLNVPLGVDSTPLGLRKCIDPLSAVASLGSGILNYFSNQDANRSNLRMTRETNEMNYKIANEANQMSQAQFDKNMKWLREQYYDTDQLSRLKSAASKAGFNPALALGSVQPIGSVGQASPTQFHTAHMESGHIDPFQIGDGLSESIGHAVDAYYNNQLKKAETDKMSYDAQISKADAATRMRKNVAELRSMRLDNLHRMKTLKKDDEEYNKLRLENEEIDWSIKRMLTDWDENTKRLRYGNELLRHQGETAEQETIGMKIENKFKPALLRSGINVNSATAKNLIASAEYFTEREKTEWHYRNDVMPYEARFKELTNKFLELNFGNAVSYEDFLKAEKFKDMRNMLRLLSEIVGSIK